MKAAKKHGRPGLIFGLLFGLLVALFVGLTEGLIDGLIDGLLVALFVGLIFGLFVGLIGGLRGPEMEKRFKPNQGIWKSAQHALVLTLIGGLIFGAIGGLVFGLVFGLIVGGSASIRHFALRLMLYRMGHSPWNYARFLDHAADRLFLQKVGGGYIFVHRMLLEHFAEMELDRKQG